MLERVRWGFAAAVTGLASSGALGQADAPESFRRLFNGEDLSGWWGLSTEDPRAVYAADSDALASRQRDSRADIAQHWRVEEGVLVNDGNGLYLTTDEVFADFELLLEYRTVAGADSGVYLRGVPQVQIWDYTEAGGKWGIGADKGSGGLWNNSAGAAGKDPLELADRPFGEWNSFRIRMVGERVSVWLNDRQVVRHARMENYFDRGLPVPRVGPIQLQTHGGEIRWRNVFVREIGPGEANEILASHGEDGFESVFNGADLEGWAGPVEGYEVVDGALRCRAGSGGTIFTEREYGDFSVRFEFLLPPGGNNGLAIRYPGEGNAAYGGMCELQVLDSEHEMYASLDARQYHGSVYGQWPAHRGYLRETGEWNFQEVTVVGSRVTVELNGTRILDKDIAEISEFMGGSAHPGRERARGHFGFCGHNDPVAFRNVRIREIGG